MKNYQSFLLLFLLNLGFTQQTFKIEKFSDLYSGKVVIADDQIDEVFKKGTIYITNNKTKKVVIKMQSEELTFNLNQNKNINANIKQLPYGEQSLVICEDFNFDGTKDLAIMDGQNSCYHGPSFQIYLQQKGKLVNNDEFTTLAQENCGMFQIDAKRKLISTSTKSGCCWHQNNTYKVTNGQLCQIEEYVIDHTKFPYVYETTTTFLGKKQKVKLVKTIDFNETDTKILFEFTLKNSAKKVVLFKNNEKLNYVFMNENGEIELNFPNEESENEKILVRKNEIKFENKKVTYKIIQAGKEIYIVVFQKNKTTKIEGDFNSIKGNFENIIKIELENIIKN